jgi:hypothetical protein
LSRKSSDRRAERPGEDKRSPEQHRPRNRSIVVECSDASERRAEHKRTAPVTKAAGIGEKIAERLGIPYLSFGTRTRTEHMVDLHGSRRLNAGRAKSRINCNFLDKHSKPHSLRLTWM